MESPSFLALNPGYLEYLDAVARGEKNPKRHIGILGGAGEIRLVTTQTTLTIPEFLPPKPDQTSRNLERRMR